MFAKKNNENRIRQIEALTAFCWEVIDMYHQGVGPRTHEPMSPSLAKAMIADEINRQLGEVAFSQEWKMARLRIAGNDKLKMLSVLEKAAPSIITVRWIEGRDDEDDTVLYATIACGSVAMLHDAISTIEKAGFEVGDGTFGLFVR